MNPTDHTGLTALDLGLGLAVLLTVLLGVRRGRGLLPALASGALVLVAGWLAAAVVLAVGPDSWRPPVRDTAFVHVAHPPVAAAEQLAGR